VFETVQVKYDCRIADNSGAGVWGGLGLGQAAGVTGYFHRCNLSEKALPIIGRLRRFSMGKNTSVVLGDSQEVFLRSQIARGRLATMSEAVREGLGLLEQRELQMDHLRKLIAEGEDSGEPEEIDFDELLADLEA
jgi:antitoxin ParD1/3/4